MKHLFRISINRFVFALATVLLFSSLAFAQDRIAPIASLIPGVGSSLIVGVGKNPGGIIVYTKTGTDGKFAFAPTDSGSYNITFTGSEKLMPFNLKFAPGFKVLVNDRRWTSRSPIKVKASTKIMVIALTHEITISGTITTVDTAK